MGTLNLGAGAQFVGGANGLTDAPTGTIIQTAIQGSTNNITANSDGSYTDCLSMSFTPRRSNSKILITLMFNAYYNNNVGSGNGTSYRLLRNSTSIKEGDWTFYLNVGDYARDFYPVTNIIDFDEPNTTSAITYKLQGRKYGGSSSKFATVFGEAQKDSPAVGNTMVMKLEELSV
mgnify:CR=1 FL=1